MDQQEIDSVHRFETLIQRAINECTGKIPEALLFNLSEILNSTTDMHKIYRKFIIKKLSNAENQEQIINIFDIEKYLAQNTHLNFYKQISQKQFLKTIEKILEKKQNQFYIQQKIYEVMECWWKVFQPYKQQLSLFYQFYQQNINKVNSNPQKFISQISLSNQKSNHQTQIPPSQKNTKNDKKQFKINQQAIKFQSQFQRICSENTDSSPGSALFKTILSCNKFQFTIFLIICFFTSGIFIAISMLGYKLIQYRQSGEQSTSSNLMYFFIYIFLTLILAFCHQYVTYLALQICYKINSTLIVMIFNKITRYPILSDKTFQTVQILNTIQIDSQFFIYLNNYLKFLTYILLQVTIGFGILFGYIGISVFVGLGIMISFILINGIFFYFIANNSKRLQKARDARIKVAEQIFRFIRFIKINTLQKYFLDSIEGKRQNEIILKRKIGLIKAFSNKFLNNVSLSLIVAATLLVYLNIGNQVKVAEAFLIVIIFKNIQAVLQNFPDKITYLILVWISAQKIQKFLRMKQIRKIKSDYQHKQDIAIEIIEGEFLWESNKKQSQTKNSLAHKQQKNIQLDKDQNLPSTNNILKNTDLSSQNIEQQNNKIVIQGKTFLKLFHKMNLHIRQKQLTMIIGDIGSGKSSLLFAILGQMATRQQSSQSVHIYGSISYCPQKPWIINGTVKQNIILGNIYEQKKFKQSLYYSCFQKDLQLLQNGIQTQIGQKGVTLSGGQKVRITLARALYANKDIYLLDDILSAVDVNVCQFLIQKTIKSYLHGKTIIMPTHSIKYLSNANNIIIMDKGNILISGTYRNVSESQHYKKIVNVLEQKNKHIQNKQNTKIINSSDRYRYNKNEDIVEQNIMKDIDDKNVIQSLIIAENQQSSNVSTKTYIEFFTFCGGKKFVIVVLSLLIGKTSLQILSNIWLQKWCLDQNRSTFYLYMYLEFGIISSIFLGVLSLYLMLSENNQNRKIFNHVINSILPASLTQFFNRVPQGRLINRLGKDFSQIDDLLTNMLQSFFGPFISVISILVISIYISTFYLFIPICVIIIFWLCLYRKLIEILKKLFIQQKINISWILSNTIELIDGIDSIRAYKLQKYFFQKHLIKVNNYLNFFLRRVSYVYYFYLKVAFAASLINFTALGYCIFSTSQSSTQIGLLFAYTGYLVEEITGIGYWLAQFQCRMISGQRILKLNQIQPEKGYNSIQNHKKIKLQRQTQRQTSRQGKIIFQNYSTRYQKNLPLILKNINLTIQKGLKIGIVGRTGAGKSSLLNCMLRILEPCQGILIINGKQIKQYQVRQLRESITMIDQEAILIKGTFRQNLDPYNTFTDQQIILMLKQCNLYEIVLNKGGLDSPASNSSLSIGQKQLMCICRSLLKKNTILLIDQATASIDVNNDNLIQKVIRKMFNNSTILTIAHRLSTIQDYDKILVLNQGRVIQWGNTKKLLSNQNSIFYQMCKKNDQSYLC